MNVGMVTTWGCQCGIATYSEGLCASLKGCGVLPAPLVPQRAPRMRPVAGYSVTECWDKDDSAGINSRWICDVVSELHLDLVHFQHEFGLFRDSQTFLRTVRAVAKKVPVVITLHTVPLSTHFLGRYGWLSMLRRHAAAVVCHTAAGCASVAAVAGQARVEHIEHGTPVAQVGDEQTGMQVLGIDKHPSSIGLSFGFIGSAKNVSATVLAFGDALARKLMPPDAMFFVVGNADGDPSYLTRSLRPAMEFTGALGLNLRFIDRFIRDEEIPHIFAAADYGVLNTTSDNLSASGQVHQLAAYGVAAAVANRPIYAEGIVAGAIPFELGDRVDHPSPSLVAAIGALSSDKALRDDSARRMRAFGEATSWPIIAGRHAELYKQLIESRQKA